MSVMGEQRRRAGSAWAVFAPCLILAVLGGGCHRGSWILATQVPIASADNSSKAVVTSTDRYREVIGGPKMIAYKMPDDCKQTTVGETTGQTRAESQGVRQRCGVLMAELERGFVRRDFKVISTEAFTGSAGDIETARDRGTKVLLVVNSFETGAADAEGVGGAEVAFFESDSSGTKGEPTSLDAATVEQLRRHIPQRQFDNAALKSATLHVTAIETATGQSIWFYRHTVFSDPPTATPYRGLFYCYSGGICDAQAAEDNARPAEPQQVSKITIGGRASVTTADPNRAEYYKLIQKAVESMIKRYVSGD